MNSLSLSTGLGRSAGFQPALNFSAFQPKRKVAILAICFALLLAVTAPSLAETKAASPPLVSLAPSNTELLLDVGARELLGGVCTNCPQVLPNADEKLKNIPIVGTFVTANLERLTRIKPQSVLLVSGQEAIAHMLNMRGFNVVVLKNDKLSDIPENLRRIGKLCRKEERADALSRRFNLAKKELNAIISGATSKPKVFYCTWAQPLLTIGKNSFLNDVITTCGGTNIAAQMSQPYPHFSAERLIVADPDIVILPYDAREQELAKRFPWNKLRAIKNKKLFYSPPPREDMLSRPAMGVLDGLYWMSLKLHPELEEPLGKWHARFMEKTLRKSPASSKG